MLLERLQYLHRLEEVAERFGLPLEQLSDPELIDADDCARLRFAGCVACASAAGAWTR